MGKTVLKSEMAKKLSSVSMSAGNSKLISFNVLKLGQHRTSPFLFLPKNKKRLY